MKLLLTAIILLSLSLVSFTKKKDTRYYELRIYYCHPGKLDNLITRFTDHTTRIFEKHGMENIGYWLPTDNKENALYYVLAYPDKAAREASWKAFGADPEWKEVASKSEANGKIVAKVKSVFMNAAAISPAIRPSATGTDRSFELRTYHCLPGQLDNLLTRFKKHTRKLFEKHGMQNIAYWTSVEDAGKQPALVYMLAYPNEEAGKKAWTEFRNDPKWIKAKAESEKNGKIVDSVQSVFLKPLGFSKIK